MKFDIILKDLSDKDLEIIEKTHTLKIPNCTTKIGKYACWGLFYLDEIKLPDSLTEIEEGAFKDCYNLETVYLPDNLERIHYTAFKDCKNLKNVYMSEKTEERLSDQLFAFPENTIKTLENTKKNHEFEK